MNLDFSDDQKQLQDQIRRYLTEKCTPAVVRAGLEGGEPFSRDLYRGLAEMGVLGVAIPEAYGGVGLSHLELCLAAEELGLPTSLAPSPADPAHPGNAPAKASRSLVMACMKCRNIRV